TVLSEELSRFTRGHPAATRVLVDAIPADSEVPSGARTELATVLAAARGEGTVADELLRVLLGARPAHIVDRLAILAAARHRADGDHLMTCDDLVGSTRVALPTELWRPGPDDPPTVLRRLLLRRLAADPAKCVQA